MVKGKVGSKWGSRTRRVRWSKDEKGSSGNGRGRDGGMGGEDE